MRVISWRIWGKCDTFLLCMKFTTSSPFTPGLQGKHWKIYRRAVLFPVAAPLQNSPLCKQSGNVSPVRRESPVCRAQFPHPRKHAQHLTEPMPVKHPPPEPSFRLEMRGDALNCPVEDLFSLSNIYTRCKETGSGWLLKNSRWEFYSFPSGLRFFLTEYMQWYRWFRMSEAG